MTVRCSVCGHDVTHNISIASNGDRVYWCYRCGRNIVVKKLPSRRRNSVSRTD